MCIYIYGHMLWQNESPFPMSPSLATDVRGCRLRASAKRRRWSQAMSLAQLAQRSVISVVKTTGKPQENPGKTMG